MWKYAVRQRSRQSKSPARLTGSTRAHAWSMQSFATAHVDRAPLPAHPGITPRRHLSSSRFESTSGAPCRSTCAACLAPSLLLGMRVIYYLHVIMAAPQQHRLLSLSTREVNSSARGVNTP